MNSLIKTILEMARMIAALGARRTAAMLVLMAFMLALVPQAHAQRGWDSFNVPIKVNLGAGVINNTTGLTVTNSPVLLRMLDGVCAVDIYAQTNLVGSAVVGTLTYTLQSSPDQTNWTSVPNFALISAPTAITYTNAYYGSTNLLSTNNFLIPGTYIYPNAASGGFVGPYLQSLPYTNAMPVSLSTGYQTIGFDVDNVGSYVRSIWTATGTNWSVGSTIMAVPISSRMK
jgi:hypothetical protein